MVDVAAVLVTAAITNCRLATENAFKIAGFGWPSKKLARKPSPFSRTIMKWKLWFRRIHAAVFGDLNSRRSAIQGNGKPCGQQRDPRGRYRLPRCLAMRPTCAAAHKAAQRHHAFFALRGIARGAAEEVIKKHRGESSRGESKKKFSSTARIRLRTYGMPRRNSTQ